MNSNRVSDDTLNDLVRMSQTMIEKCKAKEWKEVAMLDQQRRDLLDQMSESGHAFDPGKLMLASQELSNLNQQLVNEVRLARDSSASEHKNTRDSRNGIAQYQAQSSY